MQADLLSMMRRRQMLNASTTRLVSSRLVPSYSRSLSGIPITNLSGNVIEPLGEQLDDLGVKYFAPSLFPAFKAVEMLEESPNITQETKSFLKKVEAVILIVAIYKGIEWATS
jgi:hypothetical protein